MQDEDHPLGRGEPLQHHQQRQADAVVEGDPVGRVGQHRLGGQGGLDITGVVGPLPA